MKNQFSLVVAIAVAMASVFTMSSCNKDDDKILTMKDAVYLSTENPVGKSYQEWAQDFWHDVYALNCATINSTLLLDLGDNVVAISGSLADTTVDISITSDQYFFIPLVTTLWDYPCPDTAFIPAQGQSVEDFLQEGASASMDEIQNVKVTFDGVVFQNLTDYRFLSDLFYFTGNPELADCWDPCITGESQAGVTDGYFLMFKKMKSGLHTLVMHGEYPAGNFEWDITVNIHVD